jgi:hypothetical protein
MEARGRPIRLDYDAVHSLHKSNLIASPDMFPRLYDPQIYAKTKPERLSMCANPALSNDLLSTSPDLVFLNIGSHLSISDLYNLSFLNKTLRNRCITTSTFQNLVLQTM